MIDLPVLHPEIAVRDEARIERTQTALRSVQPNKTNRRTHRSLLCEFQSNVSLRLTTLQILHRALPHRALRSEPRANRRSGSASMGFSAARPSFRTWNRHAWSALLRLESADRTEWSASRIASAARPAASSRGDCARRRFCRPARRTGGS